MRLLCVLLPHFPLRCEVRRHPTLKERSTIVLQSKDDSSSQKLVLDFSPELDNLQTGMSLQQALSRHGEVDLVQADTPYYWSVFNEILDGLEEVSPLVEGSELGCAYVGLDGLQLVYPDDNALISAVRRGIACCAPTSGASSFDIRMGIAEGKFLAYLMARFEGTQVRAQHAVPLQDLPCDVLPVSSRSKSKLQEFGIRTLGQVRKLGTGPLQAQFGPEGKRILDLARGYDNTPLYPRSMEETIEESTQLASVTVSMEAILVTVESLLSRAFARNSMKGRGIRSLALWTRTWDGTHWERSLQFKEPSMDTKGTIQRIKTVMENYPQPGPVEQVGLKITRLGYGYGRQKSLFSEVRAQDHLMEDIKQLEFRLGTPQIFKVKEVEPWSRIPERRYALRPLS
jgi:DNA polymerase-4/protein ImuB